MQRLDPDPFPLPAGPPALPPATATVPASGRPPREPGPAGTGRLDRLSAAVSDGLQLALLYGFATLMAIVLQRLAGDPIPPLWFGDAIACAMLVARPRATWGPQLAGAGGAALLAGLALGEAPAGLAAALAPHLFTAWLATLALAATDAHQRGFDTPLRFLLMLAVGVHLPALAGATAAAAALNAAGLDFLTAWLAWYASATIGGAATLPLVLQVMHTPGPAIRGQLVEPRVAALAAAALGTTLVALAVLPFPYVYIGLPLIVAAVTVSPLAVTALALLTAFVVGTGIALRLAPVPEVGARWQEMFFYLPILMTLLPSLLLSVSTAQARRVTAQVTEGEIFRRLYRGSPAMLHAVDPEGRIVSVSQTWLDRTGYGEAEVVGRRLAEFLAADPSGGDGSAAGEPGQPVAHRLVTRDGRLLDVLISSISERDAHGDVRQSMAVVEDVSERARLTSELARAHERLHATLQSIGDAVMTIDAEGRIEYLNAEAEHMTGVPLRVARGLPAEVVLRFSDSLGHLLGTAQGELPYPFVEVVDRSGRRRSVQVSASPIAPPGAPNQGAVYVLRDVTAERIAAERVNYLSQHDALTGLPNRLLLQDRVEQAIKAAQRARARFALLFIDLDGFKPINDTHGHAAGDALLVELAGRLRAALRGTDTVSRLGGDEFVVLLPAANGRAEAEAVARKLLQAVDAPFGIEGQALKIGLSIGGSMYPEDGHDLDTLLRAADDAMYRSKRLGGGGFRFARD